MKGDAKRLFRFLDGSDKRFIIPVYQRNYDWNEKQCRQLFDDLIQISVEKRKSHFFGSIVSTHASDTSREDYLIIDGQQRITTISLLFIAIVNLLKSKIVKSENERLQQKIEETFLVDKYRKEERKLRLKPIKDDMEAFDKLLYNDSSDFVASSNITANYQFFYDEIQNMPVSIDELYDSIGKLEIIDIFVEDDENPQLIFESLNSTGLDLSEADKIRNFILMRLDNKKQENFYERYWNKIEKLTCLKGTKDYKVSEFIRHYLTLITKRIPNINDVYFVFKNYVLEEIRQKHTEDCENILQDMLKYAQIYSKIINSCFSSEKVSKIVKRLNHIDMTVIYPFFLAFFEMYENQKISEEETVKVLSCIESFIFRRMICSGYATNALNKIFCTLHYDVKKNLDEKNSYSDVLVYILENKTGSAAFPKNSEFIQALREQNIYRMQKKNKEYLFDRFENEDSVEYVNVVELMNKGDLSIEHIMPQTLTQQWKSSLGENWQEIHDVKLHTLGNLTLTGYNSSYSNKSFAEKRDCEKGFKESGLRLNKSLCGLERWGLEEIENRCALLVEKALQMWSFPKTNFIPKENEMDEISLEDSDDLTGRILVSYTYGNSQEHRCSVWAEMLVNVLVQIYSENPSGIKSLAKNESFGNIVFKNAEMNSDWAKIANDLYVYKANSTAAKLSILNRVFEGSGKDKSELIFKLQPVKKS